MYVWWWKEMSSSPSHCPFVVVLVWAPHPATLIPAPLCPEAAALSSFWRGGELSMLGRGSTFLSEWFSLFTHQSIHSLSILLIVLLLKCLFSHSISSDLPFSVHTVTLCLSCSCSAKQLSTVFIFSLCPVVVPFTFPSSRCQKSSSPGSAVFPFPHGEVSVCWLQSWAHIPMDAWSSRDAMPAQTWASGMGGMCPLKFLRFFPSSENIFWVLSVPAKKFRCSLIFLPNSLYRFGLLVLKYKFTWSYYTRIPNFFCFLLLYYVYLLKFVKKCFWSYTKTPLLFIVLSFHSWNLILLYCFQDWFSYFFYAKPWLITISITYVLNFLSQTEMVFLKGTELPQHSCQLRLLLCWSIG